MRLERILPGRPLPAGLDGAVLTRDVVVARGERWAKGRRLGAADLARLAGVVPARGLTLIVPEAGDLHEDEAALRLAAAVAGPGLEPRGPVQSRVDLLAAVAGVVRVRLAALERFDRLDALECFTLFDGQVVAPGDLVASVKVAPHVVREADVAAGERAAAAAGGAIVSVEAFRPRRVGVIVKETVTGAARERFEASVRAKVEGLGSTIAAIRYVTDEEAAVRSALAAMTRGRGPERSDLVLTAGAASTDPLDPVFTALTALGGRIVRHGVPSHPGSMLWLGRLGRVPVLGLPTCGAYSKATAADLLLPRLLAGEPPTRATVARLGHGGILTRSMRFRFPAYARELDAPEG